MINKSIITVFTPTYNRANLLGRLYESLTNQTNHNFIWLVVDDGSKDDTENIVRAFIEENRIDIRYYKQDNHGKYVAHNTGVELCDTELFVCVDSDDYLYPDAIKRTIEFWNANSHDGICGIVSPRDLNGHGYFCNQPEVSALSYLYTNGQLKGDTMLVFRSDVLKKFLFPVVDNENFMSEEVIYLQIDQEYKYLTLNEYLYKGVYIETGLTRNIEKIHWKNPKTTSIMYKVRAAYSPAYITRCKSYASYLAWMKVRNLEECLLFNPISFSVRLIGTILMGHYFKLFNKNNEGEAR